MNAQQLTMSSGQPIVNAPQIIVPAPVPNQQPVIIQIVKQPGGSGCGRVYKNYKARAGALLAGLQIVLGCASIIFNCLAISFGILSINFIGYGIFSPVLWFIAGAFGIASACNKTLCPIMTCMVMSIFSAVTVIYYLPLTAVAVDQQDGYDKYDYEYSDWICTDSALEPGHDNCSWVRLDPPRRTVKPGYYETLAMDVCMLVTCVLEGIVAILASVLCCQVLCCGRNTDSQVTEEDIAQIRYLVNQPGSSQSAASATVPMVQTEEEKRPLAAPTAPQYIQAATDQPPPYSPAQ